MMSILCFFSYKLNPKSEGMVAILYFVLFSISKLFRKKIKLAKKITQTLK